MPLTDCPISSPGLGKTIVYIGSNGVERDSDVSNANVITSPIDGVTVGLIEGDRYLFGLMDSIQVYDYAVMDSTIIENRMDVDIPYYAVYDNFGNDISGNENDLSTVGSISSTGSMTYFDGNSWLLSQFKDT